MAHLDRLCLNKVDRREEKVLLAISVHDCTAQIENQAFACRSSYVS